MSPPDVELRDEPAVLTATGELAVASVSVRSVALLALYLVAWNFALIAALIVLWPGSEELLDSVRPPPIEIRYLLISMTAGGLGSMMPLMLSLASWVGTRRLRSSWILWYLLRPVIGMTVGIFIYIVIRGGILKVGSSPDQLNQYAIAGFSLLGGLFSREILEKAQSWVDRIEFSR